MRLLIFLAFFLPLSLHGQITVKNASFEDEPMDAAIPTGWFPSAPGTTPDILPGYWNVYLDASEGETYVGLITRDDGTFESIGQRLSAPLQVGSCYSFTFDVAHSKTYYGYDKPLKVRIWGSQLQHGKDQLLIETDFITSEDWQEMEVEFVAKKQINYILIEAYYKSGTYSYKGNILIDNISIIKKCIRA